MQLSCDALKVHYYLYKCRSWPRIGRMSCGSARASGVLEVKVKMRRFGEKEMMGRRVWGGGKVEPVYEPISFSAKASSSSIYYFMPPISYFMADCTFWGANCLLTVLLHSIQSEKILRSPHLLFHGQVHIQKGRGVQIADWSLVQNGCTSPGNGSCFLHSATCGGGND